MSDRGASPVVLFLCDYQAPYGGNFIASMVKLDAALCARGVSTQYLFPAGAAERDWYRRMEALGMRLAVLPTSGALKKLFALLSILDERQATILHVHFGLFPLAEAAALLRPKLRLILHFHSDFSAGRAPSPRERLREWAKRIPETLIGKSRLQKITVSECSARTTRDCIPLRNALVPERFTDCTWTREQTRSALGVPDDATLLLVFGWSPFIKGVDVAANAVKRLIGCGHTQFHLGIVCGREYTPERMRAFLGSRCALTGDEPWIRLLAPVEDVFRYHLAADVMISASRSETFSYALLEAVYTGRMCVASDIPGVRWAETFDTVRFFPSCNDIALSETLLGVEDERHTAECAEQIAASSARAKKEYGVDAWVDGMLAVYGV